jgi:hypothetical protein
LILTSSGTQTAGAPSEPFSSQPPHGFGTVAITSDPDDAEIYVDEQFAGNTPAKLKSWPAMVLKQPDLPNGSERSKF